MTAATCSSIASATFLRIDDAKLELPVQSTQQTLRHIQIAREISGVGQHHPATRTQIQRCRQRLHHIERQRIGERYRIGRGADDGRDSVTYPLWKVNPTVLIP